MATPETNAPNVSASANEKSWSVALTDDPGELREFAGIVGRAMFVRIGDVDEWLAREGAENVRLIRRGGSLAGGLAVRPMGQWFGGRSVPMTGIRCVAIAPEHRGGGAASVLMQAVMTELYEQGVALSTLYPATQPVYRRVGYERAGVRLQYRLPVRTLRVRDREVTMRPIEPADHPAVKECYDVHAQRAAGNLDRGAFLWRRVLDPPPWVMHVRGYLIEGESGVEGYIVCVEHDRGHSQHAQELGILDLVALTPRAGRRLLTFLSDHFSMCKSATWFGAPTDPLMLLLPDHQYAVVQRRDWMVRLIDVRRALEARGYPEGLRAELHLEVADDVLPGNQGRVVLDVSDGRGRVSAGGRGDLRVDVRGLASLFTGYVSAFGLRTCGYLSGEEKYLPVADAIFAGPAPWMPDMF